MGNDYIKLILGDRYKSMIRKLLAIVMTVCVVVSIFGCEAIEVKKKSQPATSLVVGDTPPDFTANLTKGYSITLSEEKGKVVILNFWATWCGPCVGEMPAFQRLYGNYGDTISIITINMGESQETVEQFVEDNRYYFPVAYDPDREICDLYPIQGIPYTLILDSEGVVRYIFTGAMDADSQYLRYEQAINELLRGN